MENLNLTFSIPPAAEDLEGPLETSIAQQARHVAHLSTKLLGTDQATNRILTDAIIQKHILVTRAAGFDAAPPWAQELHGMF